jgi:hypothetical protein
MGMVGHYHEDEYGMREILPMEFWPLCAVQLKTPEAEAAQKLKASDPLWVEVYRVYEKPQDVAALAVRRDMLVAVFGVHLPRYERVETGTFNYIEPAPRHEGFGFNGCVGIYFDYDENEIVQHIWLVRGVTTPEERAAFIDALGALSVFGRFLFFDRLKSELMRADDQPALMRYFSSAAGDEPDYSDGP